MESEKEKNKTVNDTQNQDGQETKPSYVGQLGGARKGAGRKKGGMNEATKMRNQALQAYKKKVAAITDRLFTAQAANALGNVYLFRIDEEEKTKKDGTTFTFKKHVLIDDKDEIAQVMEETEGGGGVVGGDYYYITAKKPDNKAIDSMMDRTYGKAQTNIDLKSGGEKINFVSEKVEGALNNLFPDDE